MATSPYSASLGSAAAQHRNYARPEMFKDQFIEWIKGMLYHSFVLGNDAASYLDTCSFIEEIVDEHRKAPNASRLLSWVPTVGLFHTALPMRRAFELYDRKYAITSRRMVAPSFNEIRHMLNIAQILAISTDLRFISFDGDQTLYSDGGNFEEKEELSYEIIALIRSGVYVAVITAAGYGLDGSKYEVRLQGLLRRFIVAGLDGEQIGRFFVVGGECNYLLRCTLVDGTTASLVPVPVEEWQAETISGGNAPRPSFWPAHQVTQILDIAEASMTASRDELRLRARILRKERAVGIFPGGAAMAEKYPQGHGSLKLKREALDEVVLRAMEALRKADPPIALPFCAFNGGRDAWLDVGNKRIGVEALSKYLNIPAPSCLHVGDQFLHTGNDFAARQVCPCIWITGPNETLKVLEHVLNHCLRTAGGASSPSSRANRTGTLGADSLLLPPPPGSESGKEREDEGRPKSPLRQFNVYTGE